MIRYIDADILIKVIDAETEFCDIILTPKLIDDYANRHPVDVQPVVHGKWDICSNGYYPYCSVCRCEPENGKMTKYCPNCGARMDGDING